MNKRVRSLLCLAVLLTLTIHLRSECIDIAEKYQEKNIIILHSYHQGLEWTDNISEGILDAFKDCPEFNLVFEYMDTKRNSSDSYLLELKSFLEIKKQKTPIAGIIASDNAAYDFLTDYGTPFYKDAPIVFCGVNKADTSRIRPFSNYYLFRETADHLANLNAISQIFPEKDTIVIINDNTLTGQAIRMELEDALSQYHQKQHIKFLSSFTLQELKSEVAKLSDANIIYLLVVNQDKNGKFISYRNGIKQIQSATDLPIFGSWDFYLNKGLFGGKITSGYQQGMLAAQLLKRIIKDSSFNPEKKVYDVENKFIFDNLELIKHKKTKEDLPQNCEIINKKSNNTLKYLLVLLAGAFLLIIVLIVRLLIRRKRQHQLKIIVDEKTEELKNIIQKKDEFFSILAHDLRSPLGALMNMSKLLLEEEASTQKEQKSIQQRIERLSTKTFCLLEDLIFWGKMQFKNGPEPDIRTFRLAPLIQELTSLYNLNRSNITIKNEIKKDQLIDSDEFILKYIMRNLAQNAIKYSHKNGKIIIGAKNDSISCTIWVQDFGIGMSQKTINSIKSGHPLQTKGNTGQSSYGLGLKTVISYLKLLKGELHIESEEGLGSTFSITLPCKLESSALL